MMMRKRAMRFRKCLRPTVEKKLYDLVVKEREKGMRISTIRVLQESKRIAQEDNIEDFKAYPSWVFGFMRRNNLSVRSSTSVGQKLPSDWEAKVAKFRLYLKKNLCGVDFQHFGNMDEVPVSFNMPASRTVNLKGAKEVSVTTTGHERSNFTVVLCVTAYGSKLPPMVIFKRKTIPKGCESKDVIVTANQKGWRNSEVMKFWLNNVWRKRKMAFFNPKSVLLLDSCRAHITPEIKFIVSKYSRMAIIPGGLTKKLQPLHIAVNKPFKGNLRAKWENWMMADIHEYNKTGQMKRPSYKDM
ncbi:hypothetical protein J437_LFUL009714 [Ladona fulva]|uniref:HTH CENPB-type domain-containing protein n=1 Tax=Ladona fulva TaxID=123851 RepID=A0A8K0K8E8_LADFU|nr:hypothetical protein J437_LFUL009714 [Ladona fulva]